MNYWEGLGDEAGSKWAIAISSKQDWRSKVKSDVDGIVGTNRGYSKIIFITNQFVRDKVRAEVEDKLTKEFGLPIVIHDRTWILDRVFTNNRENIAIEELKLGEGLEETLNLGPNDAERSMQLSLLNKEIEDALSHAIITITIVSKALSAALVARGMEKTRYEIEGLFGRAVRIAEKLSSPELLFSVKYHLTWTT